MAEIRLSKLTKEFNIGLQTLVDFLNEKGAGVDMNPNAKISDSYLPAIEAKFGDEQKLKQDSEKVAIKLKEIIELGSKKKSVAEDEEEPVKEIIIKSNSFSHETPVQEPQESHVQKTEPAAEESEPAAKEKTAGSETGSVSADRPEEDKKTLVEGLKIVDKIDLSRFDRKKNHQEKDLPENTGTQEEVHVPAVSAEPELASEPVPESGSEPEKKEEPAAGETQVREPREIKIEVEKLQGPKVVDKIDLSQFDKKKKNKKRERIAKGGSQKVDVTKVSSESDDFRKDKKKNKNEGGKKDNRQDNASSGGKGKKRDRFKPAMTEAEEEEMQKEIQKQIKETYARMNESKSKNNFGAKHRREKRELASQKLQEEMEQQELEKKILKVTEFVTVNDMANLMNIPVTKIIGACMSLGLMVSINQRLDAETIVLVAEEFGYEVEFVTAELTEAIEQENDDEGELVPRPPVITVMGHVDHGKTSLLDYIRKSNVIAGEAGGITQHIGAYNVVLPDGKRITFLDTPGHEAFTAMRARGAKMTDLAIIIIAADDAIMPQTVEAINHAQAAGVPMVFAINKIDKPGANPDKIREQLANMNLLVEEWGGKYQCQEISAKKGINVDKLLDKVLLEAELLELKANPKRRATGAVIESSLDKGRGYLATVLVQNGTMRVGDVMLSGCYTGRVKAMFNERGQKVEEAGPSTPVSVLGLNGAPTAGETFNVMADEKEAKDIANKREQLIRIQGIKTQKHLSLEEIGRRIAIGNFKELNIIVKGDVDGSIEALSDSLLKLSTEEVRVNVIHKAVGAISESDVLLAAASDAIIIGFQVRPSVNARKLAEKEEIEIRLYSVIYDAINEVKSGIEGMLAPEEKEEITATAEVAETFKISKVGTIAGCLVKEGKLTRTSKVRVIRDGIVVYTGELGSLKRFKDDVKEVVAGLDCGLNIAGYNDIKVGDVVEAYNIVEIKRTL
ncbi:MAG: translation initiation factor IF-2 [Bacteroidetes bacterium]|uniref:Translation initiation factor IF-2 n=1 Tax=Candidatus Cryptobacteroides faecipullorum TaxID=2840764 RepID=A0A9D9IA56_9BACT|nr:translation initiation factor IF-2 [Candidatus Cryptobacteroides faecipullorum]